MRFWGVDRAVGYTLLTRVWTTGAGIVTLLMIGHFLSGEERGYYYTFNNILGLQVLLELGLSFVLLQFASHEKAKLEWEDGLLVGDATAKSRLASLTRLALTYYLVIAVVFFVLVLPIGLVFFQIHQPVGSHTVWRGPWMIIVFISACSIVTTPLFSMLQGCGKVKEMALMRLWQTATGSVLLWLALLGHWGLFAMPVVSVVGVAWGVVWLALRYRRWVHDLLSTSGTASLNWRAEVWPLQWKIALSWLSSYLIFQLFNPVLFYFYGPVAAGQMGMSMSVVFALAALGWAWMETRATSFGNLIARRDFGTLDQIFFPCLWQSFTIVVCGSVFFWLINYGLYLTHNPWGQRLIGPAPLGLLLAATCVNHIYFAEAVYLRAHKEEPYLVTSVVGGLLIGLSTYFLGKQMGAFGMAIGYFAVSLFYWLPAGTWIFIKKRQLWHSDTYHANDNDSNLQPQ